MKTSFRIWFLIIVAVNALHLSWWNAALALVGYQIFASLDAWLEKRALDKIFEDELGGWERDEQDNDQENKAGLTRRRLPDREQVVVTRLAQFIYKTRR